MGILTKSFVGAPAAGGGVFFAGTTCREMLKAAAARPWILIGRSN